MADVDAALYLHFIEDGEQVVRVGVEGSISSEVEVLGIGAASAHQVKQQYLVVPRKVR